MFCFESFLSEFALDQDLWRLIEIVGRSQFALVCYRDPTWYSEGSELTTANHGDPHALLGLSTDLQSDRRLPLPSGTTDECFAILAHAPLAGVAIVALTLTSCSPVAVGQSAPDSSLLLLRCAALRLRSES